VPYITIAVPSGTVIGRTFDAKIGAAPGRVTLLSEETLRIEPDDVCRIITAAAEDGRMTICAIGSRSAVAGVNRLPWESGVAGGYCKLPRRLFVLVRTTSPRRQDQSH